jgi:LmbE family N-acetylglucosaminyl deacetylase
MKKIIFSIFLCIIAGLLTAQEEKKPLNITSPKNILIVTAHPDDWEGCMGGTALLLSKQGYKINVLVASRGERGVKDESGNKLTDLTEAGRIREKEARDAIKLINGEINFMGKIDGDIYADKAGVDTVTYFLNKINPDIIFTMWGIDVPDHAAVGNMALKALWQTGMIHSKEVYFMEAGRGVQTNQFIPDFYINITEVYEEKLNIIRCHVSQNRGDRLAKLNINKIHGQLARCDQAEVFKAYYPTINSRWGNPVKNSLLQLPTR